MLGLYLAPQMVAESLKSGRLIAAVLEREGMSVTPCDGEMRPSFITAVTAGSSEKMIKFCKAVQKHSPVGSYVEPIPGKQSEPDMLSFDKLQVYLCQLIHNCYSGKVGCWLPVMFVDSTMHDWRASYVLTNRVFLWSRYNRWIQLWCNICRWNIHWRKHFWDQCWWTNQAALCSLLSRRNTLVTLGNHVGSCCARIKTNVTGTFRLWSITI